MTKIVFRLTLLFATITSYQYNADTEKTPKSNEFSHTLIIHSKNLLQ